MHIALYKMINSYGNVILPSDTKINKQNYTMYYTVFPIINYPERKLHCRQETVMRREKDIEKGCKSPESWTEVGCSLECIR